METETQFQPIVATSRSNKELTVDEVLFNVQKRPVYVEGSKGMIAVPGKKAIVREDTQQVLSIMSDSYVPVANKSILTTFADIADKAGIQWYTGKCYTPGNKTYMEIVFPENKLNVGKIQGQDDVLDLRCYLVNSFDGTTAALFKAGFFRLICTNGMTVGQTDMQISYRHIGNVNAKLVENFQAYLMNKIDEAGKTIYKLTDTSFSDPESVKVLFDGSDWVGQRAQKELYEEWKRQQNSLNGWIIYNVFTYVITHIIKANIDHKMAMMQKLNNMVPTWK